MPFGNAVEGIHRRSHYFTIRKQYDQMNRHEVDTHPPRTQSALAFQICTDRDYIAIQLLNSIIILFFFFFKLTNGADLNRLYGLTSSKGLSRHSR